MFWSIWCVLVFLSVICRLLDSLKEKNAFGIYSEARWTEQWTEWSIDRTEHEIDRSGLPGSTDLWLSCTRSTDPSHVDRPISGATGSTRTNELFTPFYPLPSIMEKRTRLLGLKKDQRRPRRRFTSSWERFESFVTCFVWFVKICKGVHLKTIWRRSSEPLLCFNTILSCFLHQNRFVLA